MARARRRTTKKRKGTKMREGECRVTRNGQTYCKEGGEVRFVSGLGDAVADVGRTTTRRGRSGSRGKTCQRFKRVPMKGKRGTVRRCAKFN